MLTTIILPILAKLSPLRIVAFTLVSCLATIATHSQQADFTGFGTPDLKELQLRECSFDKNAAALKLLDFQQSEVIVNYNDIKIETDCRVRIKIFNEKGFDFASITIPYVGRKREAKIKDLSAYVYNLDSSGQMTTRKIEKKQVFRETVENGVKKIVFTFPDLRPGSVIEYRYTKIEHNRLHFEPWFFQDRIPTLVSSCKIIRPALIPIDQRFITTDSVEQKFEHKLNRDQHTIYYNTFTLRNVPAFRFEPMMNSVKDNLQRIEFALTPTGFLPSGFADNFKSWNYWNHILLRSSYFGKAIIADIPGTSYILDSVKKLSDTDEKIGYIFHEVKHKLKWDEDQTFYSDDVVDAWKTNTANSAEMNIILLNLMRKAGISSYPLLVSTRENGKTDKEFMSLSQFNGVDVIALTKPKTYILDATQKYQSHQTSPLNVLNREAFLIDTSVSQWVYLSDERPLLKNVISAVVNLKTDGAIDGEAFSYYYDFAKVTRLTYKPEKKEDDEEKKFIEKESVDINIDSLKEENADEDGKPLIDYFHFTGKLSNTGDYFFVDPFLLSNFRKNPFTDSLRTTEIDFGSNQYYNISTTIALPDGFGVDHLPRNQILRSQDSSILFKRIYFFENNTLVLRNIFEVLKPVYDKEEYGILKEFFQKMYGMVNEQIVLKRK